jgi:hypothetical protein
MKRIWLISGAVLWLASSCFNSDMLNISDSLETEASYSLPAGSYTFDINDYLENLDTVTVAWPDSLYFNNQLFPNMADAVLFSASSAFDFNLMPNAGEEMQSIELVVVVSNGYPCDLSAQVYFDSGDPAILPDSAFADGARTQPGAPTNSDGVVTEPSARVYTIPMPADFLNRFTTFSSIRVAGALSTRQTGVDKTRFFSEYRVMVHVGYRIVLKINTGQL